jgi:CBS domain-containing protein
MIVATILRGKGANVVTARPESTISEISKLLHDAKIGAVIVSSDRDRVRVDGILSERDVVRAIAANGEAALTMSVAEVMTREVVTCAPSDNVAHLMAQMTAGRFRHMPVIDEGALIGIVSIGDVVRVRVEEIENEAEALRTYVTQG